jgi:hemolysin activation/secretion protein
MKRDQVLMHVATRSGPGEHRRRYAAGPDRWPAAVMNGGYVCAVLCIAATDAQAMQLPAAGAQIQQIPPAPVVEAHRPGVPLAASPPSDGIGSSPSVAINVLRFSGAAAFSQSELVAAAGFRPGGWYTIDQLRHMAVRIAQLYQLHGYLIAQAYLPAQDITDGTVTIAILEGRLGKILMRNRSSVSDSVAHALVDGLQGGDAVSTQTLEQRLLLLTDLPGVQVQSALVPGASVGASDLVIDMQPGQRLVGAIEADNDGNRYTGGTRAGAVVGVNNPFGWGDTVTLRLLGSSGGLRYGRAAYQVPLGRWKAGLAHSTLRYQLGAEFATLNAVGMARIASAFVGHTMRRTRSERLVLQLDYDDKTFRDKAAASAVSADKSARALRASLIGEYGDPAAGQSHTSYALALTRGDIVIANPAARQADLQSVRSGGLFGKLGVQLKHRHWLAASTVLELELEGQLASKNLDISDKMSLGGAGGVRAYPSGEAFGDQGYLANVELHQLLPLPSDLGRWHLIGFAESGAVRLNRNALPAGIVRRSLSAAGIGAAWFGTSGTTARAYLARKLGSAKATSAPDEHARLWLQLTHQF